MNQESTERSTGKKPEEPEQVPRDCVSKVRAVKEWLGLGQGPGCGGENEMPQGP